MAMAAAASTFAGVLLCAAAAAAFVTTAHTKTVDGDLVAKSCANATGPDRSMWLHEKFCNSRLRLDKRSAVAKHPRDLVLVATDLTQRAVADAYVKVDGVLRSDAGRRHDNSTATLILQHCQLDYAAVTSTIPVCRAMVEDYNKKPTDAANPNDYFECSHRLRRNTSDCLVRIFEDDELIELLSREVGEAWLRTILVEAMLEEMLGVVSDDHEPDTVINPNVS